MGPPADIIVVGAGIIGCAVAHELARRGASVEVIDERPVGMGATQASAGALAPFIEARPDGPLLELAIRSLDLYDDFMTRVSTDSGIVVPYRRTGTLDVALDADEMRALRSARDALMVRGIPCRVLDATAVKKHEPLLAAGAAGGLIIESHAFVAAAELTRALAAAARRAGAQVTEQSRVRRIATSERGAVVETDRRLLTAGAVVLAAGSWSGQIPIEGVATRLPVRPVRGQLLWLDWDGALLRHVTWSRRCYLVPWEDGTVLVGATVEDAGFDERATVAGVGDLLDAACHVVPHARVAGFRGVRVGLRPATPDGLPVIGASAATPNLMYASGHYRNGVLLAPLTAKLVADAMLENRIDPLMGALSPARFGEL